MSVTMMANMINPEVMGDMINAKIEALLKITPYAHLDTSLQGVPGDTKTVPMWKYIGDAADVAEGDEVDLTEMHTDSNTFTIKKAMKAVGLTQEAINSGLGNPIGQAENQLAKSIAGKVETDVLNAAYTSTNIYDGKAAVIAYPGIVGAVTRFEDEEDNVQKVLFIHPAQEATLLVDSDFLSADKFEAGVAVNGAIGKIAGCWVKKSKRVILVKYEKNESGTITIVADSVNETTTNKHLDTIQPNCVSVLAVGDKVNAAAANYYACPIIKYTPDSPETEYTEDEMPALTIFLKKDTQTDHEWKPRTQTHEITSARYYGVALTNEEKVIIANFKA